MPAADPAPQAVPVDDDFLMDPPVTDSIDTVLKQLEEDGLVQRRTDPHDNRYTLVALAPDGQALAASMQEQRASFQALLTAGIPEDELIVLRRCLARVRENALALRH